jgi:hypothetical protein
MRRIVCTGLIGLLSACAVSKVDPLAVPLVYKSGTTPVIAKAAFCSAVSLDSPLLDSAICQCPK